MAPRFSVLVTKGIDDVSRFGDEKKLCAYAGLVPSTYASGGKVFHGRITKTGNKWGGAQGFAKRRSQTIIRDGNSLNPARAEYSIGSVCYSPSAASDVNRVRVHAISSVKLQRIDDASNSAVSVNGDSLEPAIVVRPSIEDGVDITRDMDYNRLNDAGASTIGKGANYCFNGAIRLNGDR